MKIAKAPFGVTKDGKSVSVYTLSNEKGMIVRILDFGCIIQSVLVPDKNGALTDLVLGYDDIASYEQGTCFYGAFVGRYANRIKGAAFTLNGKEYVLPKNDGDNHLHGTFATTVFEAAMTEDELILSYISPDGEEGYPGTLTLNVIYHLSEENELEIEYLAKTDADTVINLTNHSYFNLNGQDGSTIYDHTLWLDADRFTEGDAQTLPTGRILSVEGTPFDFRCPKTIGQDIFKEEQQLVLARGYDHNLILNTTAGELQHFAYAQNAKYRLDAYTTQPAVQLYTGNYLDADPVKTGKQGISYPFRGGFCLETQHYPCSPNFPEFPTTVLKPGQVYQEKTVYQFTSLDN